MYSFLICLISVEFVYYTYCLLKVSKSVAWKVYANSLSMFRIQSLLSRFELTDVALQTPQATKQMIMPHLFIMQYLFTIYLFIIV